MDRIDNSFEIKEMIGEGQFSKVFHATYRLNHQKYALKIIPNGILDKHYIMNEVRLGSILDHSKIVKVAFSLKLGPYFCIAMERVKGCTLNHVIASKKITEEKAKQYVIEIIDALLYLHSHGIVHRDIKASNIMITEKGIKLIDLGTISFSTDPEEQNFLKKLTFERPEQLLNDDDKNSTKELTSNDIETSKHSEVPENNQMGIPTQKTIDQKNSKDNQETNLSRIAKPENDNTSKYLNPKSQKLISQNDQSYIKGEKSDTKISLPNKKEFQKEDSTYMKKFDYNKNHYNENPHNFSNPESKNIMKNDSNDSSNRTKLRMLSTKKIDRNWIKESVTYLENVDPLQTSRFRCGTLFYLAPEGKIPIVSTKLDIWAFACLIYKMVTGQELNDKENMQYLSNQTLKNDFSFLEDKDLSEELIDLLKNMLKYDHKERYNIRQVLESKWLRNQIGNRLKFSYCATCDTYLKNIYPEKYYVLCQSCQETKRPSMMFTGRNNWMFFKTKSKKLANNEMILSILDNWGFKNISEDRFRSLLSLCRNSSKPVYRFGNIASGLELAAIKVEQRNIRRYFKSTREGCNFFSELSVFLTNPLSFFFNERILYSRLSISRLEFILNTYFLTALDPERREMRGFDFDLRFYERVGVSKIIIRKTRGLQEDLIFLFGRILSLLRNIEQINGLEVATPSDYYIADKIKYHDDKFIEERKI